MIRKSLFFIFLLIFTKLEAQQFKSFIDKSSDKTTYKQGKILYSDEFNNLNNWVLEKTASQDSKVYVKDKKLVIDVDGGATVWLNKRLSGKIMITYKRKVIIDSGKNDRLSDFNQFWMARDIKNENLFTRSGVFSEYDSLLLYYVGFGGNTNTTTRFRKYDGRGARTLYNEYTDKAHLLMPNRTYKVETIVYNGITRFNIDGENFFSFKDPQPIKEGFFGFRTTQSRQEIFDFKIYELK